MRRASLVTRVIDPAALIEEVSARGYGAVSVFIGTVRSTNEGREVDAVEYSAYVAMAESELAKIADDACERCGVDSIVIEHRVGLLTVGQVSVGIAASDPHRVPTLDAARYAIEEIKKRVPIWKREHYSDGTREWVDPTRSRAEATA